MHINLFNYLFIKLIQKIYGIANKFNLPNIIQRLFYKIHYNYMEHLLSPYFHRACYYINSNRTFEGNKNSSIIWIFWWQGISNMPEVVRSCIQSVTHYSGDHKVILLNKDNVKNFANLPDIIYKKLKSNKLDFTHFSDILRFNILDKYGGLWVDSTIYCTNTINDSYFNYLYTTGGYQNTIPRFVKGRWAEFLIGGNSNNNMLKFVDKFLQIYFSNNNLLINYFLADYALDYAYNHNLGDYKYYVDNVAKGNNPCLFILLRLLNKTFNNKKFKEITRDTNMFKLTYKKKFIIGNTFYTKIIQKKR